MLWSQSIPFIVGSSLSYSDVCSSEAGGERILITLTSYYSNRRNVHFIKALCCVFWGILSESGRNVALF